MNLKRRLILANAATVLIPVVVTVVFALAYIWISGNVADSNQSLQNYQKLSEIQFELLHSEQSVLKQTPEAIESPEFQRTLQDRLSAINGEVAILKDDRLLFETRNFNKIDIAKSIEAGEAQWGKKTVKIGNISYQIQTVKVNLSERSSEAGPGDSGHSTGYVLLFAPVDPASAKDLTRFLLLTSGTFILSFILTNVAVSWHLSQAILSPLNQLRQAATEISSGNLNYAIVEEGSPELKELCRDLEQMRIKLKNSIHTQLKFEENRTMLISSISHDLKTPVTSIKGYIEGILDGIANTPEKQERYLKTIYGKAQQLDQMIDDLLLYAKLDLNQLPFNFERTDIVRYLEDVVLDCEPECEKSGIEVTLVNELSHSYEISLDRERFGRVLMNILDNAKKYVLKKIQDQEKMILSSGPDSESQKSQKPGQIRITLRETLTSLIIELQDNGTGIPEKDLPHIFERFYRSDTSRGEIQGSGLGLAIAKQIVEGHDGRIWAVSREGEGTRILISLRKD